LELLIAADHDTYIDMNIQLYIRGKLTKSDGTSLELTDNTCVVNNLLLSLFEHCNISLNGLTITHAADLYHYRAYLETLLTYGSDAVASHLKNSFWYPDTGDLGACDPTAALTNATNTGCNARCD
jgi:hypothetical protein